MWLLYHRTTRFLAPALTPPRRARARARHTKPPPGLRPRTHLLPLSSHLLTSASSLCAVRVCVSAFQQGGDGEAAGRAMCSRAGGAAAAGGVHGRRGGDHHAEAAPARVAVGGGAVVLRALRGVGRVGGGRVVPALRLGAVPLHPRRVRVRALRPPRHRVPQVPVAARPAVRAAQVRRRGAAADVGRQDGDVRGRLAGAEPVRVAAVHAPRRRGLRRADHPVAGVREDRPLLHRPLRGLQRDRRVLPDALPGGPRDGGVRAARPQAGRHRPGQRLARRRRARLRLLALVAAHRPHAALGLHPGGRHGGEGHGPHAGLHQGAAHLGQVGRRQPCPDPHQGLLPGDLALSLQGPGLGRVAEEDVHGGDAAAQRHDDGDLPRRADPAAGHPARRAGRDGQARLPPRLHLPVAAAQGRAPHQVRRRHLRRRLHALVPRRTPGHLERPLLRRAHRPVAAVLIDWRRFITLLLVVHFSYRPTLVLLILLV